MTTPPAPNLLIVDDDPLVLRSLDRALVQLGYQTRTADDPERARELIDVMPFDAVIADLNLWMHDGRTFAATVTQDCSPPLVVMTGMQDFNEITRLLGGSAPRALLAKPFDQARMLAVLREVLAKADPRTGDDRALTCELAQGMVRALALRDVETESHAQRVALWTRRVSAAIGMSAQASFWAQIGALLHDVGKIGVPDTILKKPGSLTDDEWVTMRHHSELGAELIAPVKRLSGARELVLHHHEAWDGSGYPFGLAGEAIPLAARVFSPIDAYDAMTSDRPYRGGMPHADALGRLAAGRGKQFDAAVIDAILAEPESAWLSVRSAVSAGLTLSSASLVETTGAVA